MTSRVTRLSALGAAVLMGLAALGVGPTYAGDQDRPAERRMQLSDKIRVVWHGEQPRPKYQKVADVPGIGQTELICRPNNTILRIRANDRRAETQMWMAKFETKNDRSVVAVKTLRIYTFDTSGDDGTGGTGWQAHEGLNQWNPIEDFSKGSAYGVISQRPGRQNNGGGALALPATSFRLNWWWERFAYPGSQYCKMTLKLHTDTERQFGLSWHGDDEAANTSSTSTPIPGFGTAQLRCETGRNGTRSVALATDDPNAFMDYEYITEEGAVSDHVVHYKNLRQDPFTGLVGPVPLPTNGMMRIWWSVNGVKKSWVLSSYVKGNSTSKPELNYCEVAAAPMP